MHCVAYNRYNEVVRLLLEKDANINTRDENNYIALYRAVAQEEASIIKLLLEYNANIDLEDLEG